MMSASARQMGWQMGAQGHTAPQRTHQGLQTAEVVLVIRPPPSATVHPALEQAEMLLVRESQALWPELV